MTYRIPTIMRATHVINPGKNSTLQWELTPLPKLAADALLIKVAASGVNRADLMQRQGMYPPPVGDSDILGLEVAGLVVAVGDERFSSWIGKRVFGLVNGGGYAEYVTMPVTQAMVVPDTWTWLEAAATAETFLTAYQLLFLIGNAQPGQRVVLHAGASGVGTSAIQLAKASGLLVAVTVGSVNKVAACLRLGADIAINYREESFSQVLGKVWRGGADIILDPVAGAYIAENIQILAEDGRIIIYALMGGRKLPECDLSTLFRQRGQLICSTLRNRSAAYKAMLTAAFVKHAYPLLSSGHIKPEIQRAFAITEVTAAHQLLTENNTIGKLVLVVDHTLVAGEGS